MIGDKILKIINIILIINNNFHIQEQILILSVLFDISMCTITYLLYLCSYINLNHFLFYLILILHFFREIVGNGSKCLCPYSTAKMITEHN